MNELMQSEVFLITLTLGIYLAAQKLYVKTKSLALHPVLVTIVVLIGFLFLTGMPYETYKEGTHLITFCLGPSVVALGVPLYRQLRSIKKNLLKVLTAVVLGSAAGIFSVMFFAWLFGASKEVILSMAPKSVTTPIAIGVSETIGGIAPLTAGIVVSVGIFGAICGQKFLKVIRVTNPEAVGLAVGSASHGIGTAQVAQQGYDYGAYSSLGMALSGVVTAVLTPWIVTLWGWVIGW